MKSLKDTMAKAMTNMFAPVDNVKYDLASGQTGIVTDGGLVTLGSDGALDQNPMDFFSLELPAFAMLTPAKDIQRGDIIVSSGKAYGFILEPGLKPAARTTRAKQAVETDPEAKAEEITKGELQTINVQGHVSRFRPKRVTMMGVSDGLLVVRSFNNLFGAPSAEQQNPIQAMLPLMLMSKSGNGNQMEKLLPLMMMGSMGGGQNMMNNPLMMMAFLGDGGIDGLFK